MENRANYILVGVFTLVILAASFGFIYWSANVSDSNTRVPLIVRIEGSVTGLSQGSQVLFNGLNVGSVSSLRIDPNDPRTVIATAQVDRNTPITTSTQATIGFQGLTGIGFIGLSGGSASDRNIIQSALAQGAVPVIRANPSDVTDILATARDISDRANNILGEFERLVLEVGPAVTTTASNIARTSGNVDVFTASLAANADQIETFVASLGRLSDSANEVALELPTLIDQAANFIGALDSGSVNASIENVAAITTSVREQTPAIAAAIESVSEAAQGFGVVGETLTRNADEVDQFLAALGPLSETLGTVATELDGTLTQVNQILAAVEPEQVNQAVSNVVAVTEAVRGEVPNLVSIVQSASTALESFGRVGEMVDANSEAVNQFLASLGPISQSAQSVATRLDSTLEAVEGVATAIDTINIDRVIDNVAEISQTIRDQSDAIGRAVSGVAVTAENFGVLSDAVRQNIAGVSQFLGSLGPISQSAQSVAERLDDTLTSAQEVAASINSETLSRTIENVGAVTDNLRAQNEAIASAIGSVSTAAENFGVLGDAIRQNISGVTQFLAALGQVSERAPAIADNLDNALLSARQAADTARDVAAAVDADQIRTTVDSVAGFTSALNERAPEVQSLISGANIVVTSLQQSLAGLDETRALVDQVLSSIDPELVNQAVTDVSAASGNIASAAEAVGGIARNIGERSDDIDAFITDAQTTAANLRVASDQVQGVVAQVDTILNSPGAEGLTTQARTTLVSIQEAAAAIRAGIDPISASVTNLSDQGLREVQSLVRETTGSISRVERAIVDLTNNPSRVITGGTGTGNVREFDGRTRR